MSLPNDLVGKRFGKLIVIERYGSNSKGNSLWKCLCDCGNEKIIVGYSLTNGRSKSCGCVRSEHLSSSNSALKKTHGATHTRLYRIWRSMKQRCTCERHKYFQHYGGRGITICDEWINSFETFQNWALSNGYRDDLSIDRINVDGNYEPSNCRWATISEQNSNRRHYKRTKGEKK